MSDHIQEFHNRTIGSQYVAIYLDATYFPVRRYGIVKKEAICVALGLKADGQKEVLDFTIAHKNLPLYGKNYYFN